MFESCWVIRIEHLCFYSDHVKQSLKVSSNTLNSLVFGSTRSFKFYINLAAIFSAGEVFSSGYMPEIYLSGITILKFLWAFILAFCCFHLEHRVIFPYKYVLVRAAHMLFCLSSSGRKNDFYFRYILNIYEHNKNVM